MARKSRRDWLETGLELLAEVGAAGLTIERMTAALGVTKGSFYHHFEDVEDFRQRLVAHWADQYLSTAGNLPEAPEDRLRLLDKIMRQAYARVTEPEAAIRIWAHQDESVRDYVARVDAARRRFVLEVFRSVAWDEGQARLMADMLFAISIGAITALPRLRPKRVLELYDELKRLYGL